MKPIHKVYLSADIEGTCGINSWDETEYGHPRYAYFARQMTAEAAAACDGALAAGAEDVLVRDAHDSARNLIPDLLPANARLLRGWERHPFAMMSGLDATFDAVMFTGYHSGVGMPTNPLSHTMNTRNTQVLLNGEACSELYINLLTAAYVSVPCALVTGDAGLCAWARQKLPGLRTVGVVEGLGAATVSMHPEAAVRRIREAARAALSEDISKNILPLPDHFAFEVTWREHSRARSAGFYPGCTQTGPSTACFEADDWMAVLAFMHFAL